MHRHAGNTRTIDAASADHTRLVEQMRRYRESRRNKARLARPKPKVLTEQEEIVQDACKWAPYGPVPADHVFTKYGISRDEFADRLRSALDAVVVDERTARRLAELYPQR